MIEVSELFIITFTMIICLIVVAVSVFRYFEGKDKAERKAEKEERRNERAERRAEEREQRLNEFADIIYRAQTADLAHDCIAGKETYGEREDVLKLAEALKN